MNKNDDELISFADFARRINKSAPYIYKLKNPGKLDPAVEGKKIYFLEGCKILKIDPLNIPIKTVKQSEQEKHQKLKAKPKKKFSAKNQNKVTVSINGDDDISDFDIFGEFEHDDGSKDHKEDLLTQIENIIKSKPDDRTYLKLDSLETKTKILKNFYAAEKEKLAFEKELGNLFDRESIERILTFSFNAVRNTLLNLANNYAVNLEGLNKSEIKDYVEEDVNKILEELQNTGKELK